MASSFHPLIAFLLLLLTCTTTAAQDEPACNADDKATLLKIKAALGNPDVLTFWTPDSDCCRDHWYIVYCNPNGRVSGLSIEEHDDLSYTTRVTGRIPDEVADLPYLEELRFEELPQLKGPIPSGLAKLRHLRILSITETQVSGPIPSSLGKIKTLERLHLQYNALSDIIPASLASLPSLNILDLSNNRIAGPIPDVTGGFPKLEYVYLSNNHLIGFVPPSFLNLNQLRAVYLSNNQFSGEALQLFDASRPTSEINISRNSFWFDFGEAGIPTGITLLDISHNQIRGKIPAGIKRLEQPPASVNFDVSYNQLCGKVPGGKWRKDLEGSSFSHNLCLCGAYDLPPCLKHGDHPSQ